MSEPAKHVIQGQAAGTKISIEVTGPTVLKALHLLNTTAAVAYFQIFFRTSGDVTVGTTVPHLSLGLAASAQLTLPIPERGIRMGGNGLTVAGTTTREGSTGAAIDYNLIWG